MATVCGRCPGITFLVSPSRRPLTIQRRCKKSYLRARPLSWEIPKLIFPRPENFFPRPDRIFDGETFRDLILKQGEAVREFPWEYIILLSIVVLIIAEIFVKQYDSSGEESTDESDADEEERDALITEEKKEVKTRIPMTEDEERIYALKKIEFQAEQNRSLLVLGSVAGLALWLAGFLNTPHPFEP